VAWAHEVGEVWGLSKGRSEMSLQASGAIVRLRARFARSRVACSVRARSLVGMLQWALRAGLAVARAAGKRGQFWKSPFRVAKSEDLVGRRNFPGTFFLNDPED
jgi:hypothetical protein